MNCLQWQIWYSVLTTNYWRFQGYPHGDPNKECEHYKLGEEEDINHCLWSYPKVNNTWRWIQDKFLVTKPPPHEGVHLMVNQAQIGEPLKELDTPL